MRKRLTILALVLVMTLCCFPMQVAAAPLVTWPGNQITVAYAPTNIIVANDGTSYVTNNNGGIMKYLSTGVLDTAWAAAGRAVETIRPIFLCFDANGDILTGNCDAANGIYRISAVTGASTVIIPGVRVTGIATDAAGNIYVNDGGNLIKYDSTFTLVWTKATAGFEMGLCLLPDGSIITTSENNGSIQKYNASGVIDLTFGTGGFLDVSENNIGFASYDEALYVSCYGDSVIKRVSLDGQTAENVLTGASPTVLVAKGGFYFITNWLHGKIECFERPTIDIKNDEFTCAVTPNFLAPGSPSTVALDINSISPENYSVTAKVYNKATDLQATDITSTTATLADGDADLVLTPGAGGWAAGDYYVVLVFTETVGNITVSDTLRVTQEITVANTWTVTFKTEGAADITKTVTGGHPLTDIPGDPSRTGHSFAGWCSDAGRTTLFNFNTPIAADLTLYAKFTINQYDVTFDTQGGSTIAGIVADYDTTITAPDEPTRDGFAFAGWYKDAACTSVWDFAADKVTADTTIYAKWLTVHQTSLTLYTGGRQTLTPTTGGGLWAYDPAKVELTENSDGTAMIKALAVGATTVTYTSDTTIEYFLVTIAQAQLPVTGQSSLPAALPAGLAGVALLAAAGVSIRSRKKNRA